MENHPPGDQYITVDDLSIRYWSAGRGPSSVILLHGLGGYVENWQKNVACLAQNHRVVALDLPGFGRSDKPDIQYSIPYWTAFVQKFMRALKIDRAVLLGASMGGAIALQFALRYPQQVERLILSASAGLGKEVALFLKILSLPILGEWLSRPSRNGSEQFWKEMVFDRVKITPTLIDKDYEVSAIPGAQQSFLRALRSLVNIQGLRKEEIDPILGRLEEIQTPTLILWGAQDRVLPVACAQNAVKRFPNARLHVFDPCGHLPNYERADEFNTLVADFLT